MYQTTSGGVCVRVTHYSGAVSLTQRLNWPFMPALCLRNERGAIMVKGALQRLRFDPSPVLPACRGCREPTVSGVSSGFLAGSGGRVNPAPAASSCPRCGSTTVSHPRRPGPLLRSAVVGQCLLPAGLWPGPRPLTRGAKTAARISLPFRRQAWGGLGELSRSCGPSFQTVGIRGLPRQQWMWQRWGRGGRFGPRRRKPTDLLSVLS